MSQQLQQIVEQQRIRLSKRLREPLSGLAQASANVWHDPYRLEAVLSSGIIDIHKCRSVFLLDTRAVQYTNFITPAGSTGEGAGRDCALMPFMRRAVPGADFILSDAYVSARGQRPSLTAVQLVRDAGKNVLGFLCADFDLRELKLTGPVYQESMLWRQLKGDPAIRGLLFQQCRVESPVDQNIDSVLAVIEALLADRGVFHIELHFSTGRATIWLRDEPRRYRLLDVEDLIDPDICLTYPLRSYPADAVIPVDRIGAVLAGFRDLRFADENIYLRYASINIYNGLVSLHFSCDGSHYMQWDEFLEKNLLFWIGGPIPNAIPQAATG